MNKIKIMMRSIAWLCVTCFSLLVGCVHEDLSAVATVDEAVVTVDASVNNYSYTVTANANWTLISDSDWCVPSATSGNGTTTINLYISANESSVERSASLMLACGGNDTQITVIQSGVSTTLEVSPSTHAIDMNSNTVYVAVMSNTVWTAVASDSWATFSGSSSYTSTDGVNKILAIDCTANDLYAERSATIQFIVAGSESITKEVTITQGSQGSPAISLSSESVNIAAVGATVSVAYTSNIDFIAASSDFTWCTVEVKESTNTIEIKAEANSTVSSRSAIVSVVGFVGGEETTAQILVTQAGTASPSITLLNSTISFGASSSSLDVSYVAASGVDVALGHTDSWITVNGATSSPFTATVDANTSEDARTGTIEFIATSSSSDEVTYYYVTVNQEGLDAVSVVSNPSSYTLSAKSGYDAVRLFSTGTVTYDGATSSNGWLEIGTNANGSVEFSYSANDSDAARTATISVSYTANGKYGIYSIPVVQNGLGAPEITCLDDIVMETAADTYELYLFSAESDITNISVELVSIAYDFSATDGTTTSISDWLDVTPTNDEYLKIETDTNPDDDSRYATVTFKVTRGGSVVYKTITVTQLGHLSAAVENLDQEIYVTYEAATYNYGFIALNNSTVTPVSQPSWVTAVDTTQNTTSTDAYTLDVTVTEYDGSEGEFREGYITLAINNGNSTTLYYEILIRQYSQDAAMIEGITELSLTHDAYSHVKLGLNLLNDSEYQSVVVTASAGSQSNGLWLVSEEYGDDVKFSADAFTGPEESRTGTIKVTVKNANANMYVHTITVTQYLAEPTTITVASDTITVEYDATEAALTYSTSGSGTITVTPSISGALSTASFDSTTKPTTVTFDKNTSLEEQVSIIQLVAVSADNQISATETITLIQKAAPATTLEVSETIAVQAAESDVTIAFSATGYEDSDVTVTATSTEDWLTDAATQATQVVTATDADTKLTFTAATNTATEERSTIVTVTAVSDKTGSTVTKEVTIIQAGSGDAILTVIPNVSYDYAGTNGSTITVSPTLMSGAELVSVESSETWVSDGSSTSTSLPIVFNNTLFTYEVDAYDGAEGDTRIATIVIKAVSEQGQYSTATITVTQTAPEAITVSALDFDNAPAYDASGVTIYLGYEIGGYATTPTAAITFGESWISSSTPTTTAGYFAFELEDNTSSSPRTATILLTAYDASGNNASTATTTVTITQAAASATTLVVPANISAAADDTSVKLSYSATGDGSITVTAMAADGTVVDTANGSTFTGSNGVITIDLLENDESAARTASLIVTATSATGQSASETVTINQAGTGEAMISTISDYTLDYQAETTGITVNPTLSENTYLESVTSTADWLDITSTFTKASNVNNPGTTTSFTFKVEEYDGAEGASRIATIEVVAWNGGSTATSYITVTQTAPESVTLTTIDAIEIGYAASSIANISYTATGTGTVTVTPSVDDGTNFSVANSGTNNDESPAVVTAKELNSGTSPRTTTVTLIAKSDVSTDEVVKYVTVTQAAPTPMTISTVDAVSMASANNSSANILYTTEGDGTAVVTASVDDADNFGIANIDLTNGYVEVKAKNANTSASARTATVKIEVTTTNASSVKSVAYVTVSQAGQGEAEIELPSSIDIACDAIATASAISVYPTLGANTLIDNVYSSYDWLTVTEATDSKSFTYYVEANPSTTARIATITVIAKSGDNTTTSYITVTQAGATAIAISTVEALSASAGDATSAATVAVNIPYSVSGTQSTTGATVTASAVSGETSMVNGSITPANDVATVTLDYNPASESRTVLIKLEATGESGINETSDIKYVSITQAGTGTAEISTISSLDLAYTATGTAVTITPYLSENSTITAATSSATWLTTAVSSGNEAFTYSASAYDGASGTSRYATITLTVENGTTSTQTYISVTQAAPEAIEIVAAPTAYNVAAEDSTTADTTQTLPVYFTVSGQVTTAANLVVKAEPADSWITASTTDAAASTGTTTLTIADNDTGVARTAQVALTAYDNATTPSNVSTSTQIITITQAPATETIVTLDVPTETIYLDDTAQSYTFGISGTTTGTTGFGIVATSSVSTDVMGNSATPTESTAENFVIIALAANTTDVELNHVISVTITDDDDATATLTKNVLIVQAAQPAPAVVSLSVPSETIYVDAATTSASFSIIASTTGESGVTMSGKLSGGSINGSETITGNYGSIADNQATIAFGANTSATEYTYVATITATDNVDNTTDTKNVTIIQSAYVAPVISLTVPSETVYVDADATSAFFNISASISSGSLTLANSTVVDDGNNSITGSYSENLVSFTLNQATAAQQVYTVTIKAEDASSNTVKATTVTKQVTVIQAAEAPTVVSLTVPSDVIYVAADATSTTFSIDATTTGASGVTMEATINGSAISSSSSVDTSKASVELSPNDTDKEVVNTVAITATDVDDSSTTVTKNVTIIQYAAGTPVITMDVPSDVIYVESDATSATFGITTSITEGRTVAMDTSSCGVTLDGGDDAYKAAIGSAVAPTYSTSSVTIPLAAESLASQTYVVTLVAEEDTTAGNSTTVTATAVTKTVTIIQVASGVRVISLDTPTDVITVDADATMASFVIDATITDGGTVDMSGSSITKSGSSYNPGTEDYSTSSVSFSMNANITSSDITYVVTLVAADSDSGSALEATEVTKSVIVVQKAAVDAVVTLTAQTDTFYVSNTASTVTVPFEASSTGVSGDLKVTAAVVLSNGNKGAVTIGDNSLVVTMYGPYETETSYVVTITATDINSAGASGDVVATKVVTIIQEAADPTVVSLTVPSDVIYVAADATSTTFSIDATTTGASGVTMSAKLDDVAISSPSSVSAQQATIALTANTTDKDVAHVVAITATDTKDNSTTVTKNVTIIQVAAGTPVITMDVPSDVIYVESDATSATFGITTSITEGRTVVMDTNSCSVTLDGVDSYSTATNGATATYTTSSVTIPLADESASAQTYVVTLVATESGSTTPAAADVTKTVTIIQVAAGTPVISLTVPSEVLRVDNTATSASFSIGASITEGYTVTSSVAVSLYGSNNAITSSIQDNQVTFGLMTAGASAQTYVVTITATDTTGATNTATTVTKQVTVIQEAADAVVTPVISLTVPTETISVGNDATSVTFPITASITEGSVDLTTSSTISTVGFTANTTPTISSITANQATVTLDAAGTSAQTYVVKIVAADADSSTGATSVTKSVVIVQAATVTPVITVTTSSDLINISAATTTAMFTATATTTGTDAAYISSTATLKDSAGATATGSVNVSSDLVTVSGLAANTTSSDVYYYVTLTGTDGNNNTTTKSVVIVQAAADAFSLSTYSQSLVVAANNGSSVIMFTASGADASSATITATSATGWLTFADGTSTAVDSSDSSKATASATSGSFKIVPGDNYSTEPRSGVITITSEVGGVTVDTQIITIAQEGATAVSISTLNSAYSVDATATSAKILYTLSGTFASDYTFSADSEANWITNCDVSTSGTLALTLDANDGAARSAIITLTATYSTYSTTEYVVLTQEAAATNVDATFTFTALGTTDATLLATANSTSFDAAVTALTDSDGATIADTDYTIAYSIASVTDGTATVASDGEVTLTNITENTSSQTKSIVVGVTATATLTSTGQVASATEYYVFTQSAAVVAELNISFTTGTGGIVTSNSKSITFTYTSSDSNVEVDSFIVKCIAATTNGVSDDNMVAAFNAITNTGTTETAFGVTFPTYSGSGVYTYDVVVIATLSDGSTITSNTLTFTQNS